MRGPDLQTQDSGGGMTGAQFGEMWDDAKGPRKLSREEFVAKWGVQVDLNDFAKFLENFRNSEEEKLLDVEAEILSMIVRASNLTASNVNFYKDVMIPNAQYTLGEKHNLQRMKAAPSRYLGTKYEIGYF